MKEKGTNQEQLTPLLRQYQNIKREHKDAILFFRMGDFYEMFYDDAIAASKILEIALTTRDKRTDNPVPMCGIPYHAINSYLPKLIREGRKVAICEQVEDPAQAKGIVRREVIRVITPGTVLDGSLLESRENNFIAAIYPDRGPAGLAFVDVSTGDFFITEMEMSGIRDEMARIEPREVLLPQGSDTPSLLSSTGHRQPFMNPYPAEVFEYESAARIFYEHIEKDTTELSKINLKGPAINAAGALLHYLSETQKTSLRNINTVRVYQSTHYMTLDETVQRTLELIRSNQTGQRKGTLFHLLDKTITPMGGRLLKLWILHPLMDLQEIVRRQDGVEDFQSNHTRRWRLRELLRPVQDMERIISRISLKVANARDLTSLHQCLDILPEIKTILTEYADPLIRETHDRIDTLDSLRGLIGRAIVESPPLTVTEGGMIRDGYSKDLDELRGISREGKGWIARLEAQERKRSGIDSLKIRYNRVFGYYIEITKANLGNVPQDYIRRQTVVNAERFITPELKDYEEKVLGAEERIKAMEYQLFEEIREMAAGEVEKIQRGAKAIAQIDVLSAFAEAAHLFHYVRPVIDEGPRISIRDGRHPVVEQIDLGERFVPNDTDLDCDSNQLMILTGPNMAGKSTYMRQTALIVLMAQMGGFVPAKEATIGIVDRIFTRIGASDNLAEGRSTFMVEMEETASILRHATSRSLILLDEIGRGTSTFDGISIAWASAEYIHRHTKAKTLFATHYHELTELALTSDGIFNAHVAVREWNDEVIFLRKVMPGMADKSYGIQVARLAGLPMEIIIRAREVLANLEKEELDDRGIPKLAHTSEDNPLLPPLIKGGMGRLKGSYQTDLFGQKHDPHPVVEEIRELDLMNMTPIQALAKLDELKIRLNKQE